jgi:hypothetical protein
VETCPVTDDQQASIKRAATSGSCSAPDHAAGRSRSLTGKKAQKMLSPRAIEFVKQWTEENVVAFESTCYRNQKIGAISPPRIRAPARIRYVFHRLQEPNWHAAKPLRVIGRSVRQLTLDWLTAKQAANRLDGTLASKRVKVESYGRFGSNARRDRSHLLGAAGGLTCRRSKRPKTTGSL